MCCDWTTESTEGSPVRQSVSISTLFPGSGPPVPLSTCLVSGRRFLCCLGPGVRTHSRLVVGFSKGLLCHSREVLCESHGLGRGLRASLGLCTRTRAFTCMCECVCDEDRLLWFL